MYRLEMVDVGEERKEEVTCNWAARDLWRVNLAWWTCLSLGVGHG
jgi:hypothetical protein